MNKHISIRKSFVAAAIMMTMTLLAGRSEAGLNTANGLNSGNGLATVNGLNSNGLATVERSTRTACDRERPAL